MKKETKSQVVNASVIGGGTVLGAGAGVVIGSAISSPEAEASEKIHDTNDHKEDTPAQGPADNSAPAQEPAAGTATEAPAHDPQAAPSAAATIAEPVRNAADSVAPQEASVSEARSTAADDGISFTQIEDGEGNVMDVAVISAGGEEIAFVDADRDNIADVAIYDANGDNMISEDEIVDISDAGIAMDELAQAAGVDPSGHGGTSPEADPEVQVVEYGRVQGPAGQEADVAVLDIDGHDAAVADLNSDGIADVFVMDADDNGEIDENEIVNVSGEGIPMQPFEEEAGNGMYAHNDLPDYVDDANVDDFMA